MILAKIAQSADDFASPNQNLVLGLIFSQNYSHLFEQFVGQRLLGFLKDCESVKGEDGNRLKPKKHKTHYIYSPHSSIRFLNAFLQVLISCVNGKNSITENFC